MHTDPLLLNVLSMIRAERASTVRNRARYSNLRHMLRNIRADLA